MNAPFAEVIYMFARTVNTTMRSHITNVESLRQNEFLKKKNQISVIFSLQRPH